MPNPKNTNLSEPKEEHRHQAEENEKKLRNERMSKVQSWFHSRKIVGVPFFNQSSNESG